MDFLAHIDTWQITKLYDDRFARKKQKIVVTQAGLKLAWLRNCLHMTSSIYLIKPSFLTLYGPLYTCIAKSYFWACQVGFIIAPHKRLKPTHTQPSNFHMIWSCFPWVHLQKHDEFHQMFSATKHKTMSIQEHLDSQRYQPSEKCTTHTEKPVKMACTECCQFFCDDCNLQSNCNLEGKFFPILLQISYLVAFTLISPYSFWNTWHIV